MSMHVNLSPEMEGFIQSKVADGMYGNATEVIRDAVRRMQAEEARVAAWQAAIKLGDDQLIRGESVEYTPQLRKQLKSRALEAARDGKPMDPDVLP